MIEHTFVCDKCHTFVKDTSTKGIHKCPKCGEGMRWDIIFNCSGGDYNHTSDSLAINPGQIAEHRKKFPGVDVLPDGRIKFDSFRQHDNYLKKTGFVKIRKRIKPKKATVKRT